MSSNKHNIVIGYDINKKLISELKKGLIRFNEKNIETLLRNKIKKKLVLFSNKFIPSDVYIITVPTPLKKNNTSDLSYVYACIKKIISSLKKNDLIIIESTIPIGTTNKIKNLIDKKKPLLKIIIFYHIVRKEFYLEKLFLNYQKIQELLEVLMVNQLFDLKISINHF